MLLHMNTERRKTLTNERTGRKYVHLSQRQLPEKVIRQFIRNLIKTFLLYSTYLMHIQVTISIITLGSCQVLRASSWSKHFPLRKLKMKIYFLKCLVSAPELRIELFRRKLYNEK